MNIGKKIEQANDAAAEAAEQRIRDAANAPAPAQPRIVGNPGAIDSGERARIVPSKAGE